MSTTTSMTTAVEPSNGASQVNPSHEESEIYDRQMRLWGEEAQKRLSGSKVLFAGFGGLAAETAKNLVLAGLHATIQDTQAVCGGDLGANFFLTEDQIGMSNRAAASQARLQELNPMVSVDLEERVIMELDSDFFKSFACICLFGSATSEQRRIEAIAHKLGVPLFIADTFGMEGCVATFLGKHTFRRERGTSLLDPETQIWPRLDAVQTTKWSQLTGRWGKVSKTYVRCRLLWQFIDKYGRNPTGSHADVKLMSEMAASAMLENGMDAEFLAPEDIVQLCTQACAEISPVCAIVGGLLGQEIIKVISLRGAPSRNVLIFSGNDSCEGKVFYVGPPQS